MMQKPRIECFEEPSIREAIARIVAVLIEKNKNNRPLEFEAAEVGVRPSQLTKIMYDCGLIRLIYHSSNYKFYTLTIPIEEAVQLLKAFEASPIEIGEGGYEEFEKHLELIVGMDDEKRLLRDAIRAKEPVHILFVGPPGVGKSLLLMAVSKLDGAVMFTAGSATKAGIRDILLEYRPRYLVIDELHTINDPRDISVLLSLMWEGKVYTVKKDSYISMPLKTSVIAAANTTRNLPKELLDRFIKIYIPEYTSDEKAKVIAGALTKLEGWPEQLAKVIAIEAVKEGLGIRETIQISRICREKQDPHICISNYIKMVARKRPP